MNVHKILTAIEIAPPKAVTAVFGSWGMLAWSFIDPLYTLFQFAAIVFASVASYATARYMFKRYRVEFKEDKDK